MTGSLPRGLLLLGATGRLGRPLLAAARQQWLVEAPGRGELDLRTATESELGRLIERSGVEAVLNAAALAGVDACERSRSEAMVVNGEAPGRLARACRSAGVPLVQVSTDYVFGGDGEQAPYAEDASPAPVQHYGRSKARGEREVLDSGAAASVVRVSWLFGRTATAFESFVLGQVDGSGRPAQVRLQQLSRPTFAPSLAGWLLALAARMAGGLEAPPVLHPVGGPGASRGEWARVLLDAHGHAGIELREQGEDHSAGVMLAPRPADSRLAGELSQAWAARSGLPSLGDWRVHVAALARSAPGPAVVPQEVGAVPPDPGC